MNFYYDITLDFLENSYSFYEIEKTDNFVEVKKIPLFQVSNKVLKDFINNKVKVNQDFLNIIYNKTMLKNSYIEYACILADKNNAIALEFNEEGIVTKYSSLSLMDELNLLEVIYTIKNIDIDYNIISKNSKSMTLRKENIIKDIIKKEITKLYNDKNISKLQFLYLEWFDDLESDIDKIYNTMLDKLKDNISKKEEKISKIIEMSYNNV